MNPGDSVELDVSAVAHGGIFVARHEGRVVFVSDAIPGERVRVRLTDTRKKSFWRADTVEILDASPHRRPHVWSAADVHVAPEDRPGGADFGHIELGHQRALKREVVIDALRRFGGLDVPVDISPVTSASGEGGTIDSENAEGTRWRTRVSLHVDPDGRVGPYAARSHRVIEVDDLPLATSEIAAVAREIRSGAPGRIDLVQPSDGRVRVLARPEERPRSKPGMRSRTPEVVIESVAGRDFRVDATGFWQVHRLAAHTLTGAVRDALRGIRSDLPGVDPDGWHLDLYGGVGLFAATLGELGGPSTRVTSVESDPRATEHAGENLAEWVGARAETARVDRWLETLASDATARERERLARGVVLLDPPRAGAGQRVVDAVASLAPSAVVYVACDPVALARDLATFRARGYEPARVDAFDLFPNSHHVEAVAALTRVGDGEGPAR
ncbi:class I SAM-dependent RNA methyltransferase [Microbacterium sp. C7(2022)]|uniref:class I SAM-dependent RNA methyltransferase n=1 Tax=Microbacterium sp. C7(2022) TaxID=2992759 RepID=UPI00237C1959|nr:TRAM domain-containing protein [Microbacterium sp. C7(2022)]MDE0547339.1 TRAM domain-containing protein [Microbacterium sp. C7(2022)]